MHEIVKVADAVVSAINAATLSQPVQAKRSYLPRFELPEMADLHVTAVPKGAVLTPASRTSIFYDYSIDVAVQKRFSSEDPQELDPLLQLTEEIADLFRQKELAGYPDATWIRTEHQTLYGTDHLETLRQFTSILTLVFRARR